MGSWSTELIAIVRKKDTTPLAGLERPPCQLSVPAVRSERTVAPASRTKLSAARTSSQKVGHVFSYTEACF